MVASKRLSLIHPYIENRRKDIEKGLYPRQHLWGLEGIEGEDSWTTNFVETHKLYIPKLLERILNRLLFRQSPGIRTEIPSWLASKSSDLIYSVCGPLSLSRFYKRAKLVSWVFRRPKSTSDKTLDPYSSKNLRSHAGFLCLTSNAEESFSKHSHAKFLPWCVDLEMFDGKPSRESVKSPFFLATGKTGRDYQTLIKGADSVEAELRIIGPKNQRISSLPPNVKWLDTTEDPPDQAIDYPTLREWYAQCIGVCIPLSGDADDTCGYTNMLEAMAMRKPVLMTRSGCLHIDPESGDFGRLISPKDSNGWKESMNELLHNDAKVQEYGMNGRMVAERDFTIERFDREVVQFLKDILST
jgi:glycosyltransferase involved in cell wall biosynthesis